jgi:hypothetical protein
LDPSCIVTRTGRCLGVVVSSKSREMPVFRRCRRRVQSGRRSPRRAEREQDVCHVFQDGLRDGAFFEEVSEDSELHADARKSVVAWRTARTRLRWARLTRSAGARDGRGERWRKYPMNRMSAYLGPRRLLLEERQPQPKHTQRRLGGDAKFSRATSTVPEIESVTLQQRIDRQRKHPLRYDGEHMQGLVVCSGHDCEEDLVGHRGHREDGESVALRGERSHLRTRSAADAERRGEIILRVAPSF